VVVAQKREAPAYLAHPGFAVGGNAEKG